MGVRLDQLAGLRRQGHPGGVTSVCSAHPLVLRTALRQGRETGATVLIEATCNQVNHRGGYTGMVPAGFVDLVRQIAVEESCPVDQVVLGGDHLGPNPWRELPVEQAMAEAEKMVAAYIAAGFRKIHLDASMGCKDEQAALDDDTTAGRAVRLATVAETVARDAGGAMPVYIIGTEVPPPGGADHVLARVAPTSSVAARRTIDVHRAAFRKAGLDDAFSRVIGLVVQPGVEFGNHNVAFYDRDAARGLVHVLDDEAHLVFEAHSTDYQGFQPLANLVQDGFAILKVGPELTFVMREALYALDNIASDLLPEYGQRPLYHTMEKIMVERPHYWSRHYGGSDAEKRVLRHYSLSDRIRYYWATADAEHAVDRLVRMLAGQHVPAPLFRQYLPDGGRFADIGLQPREILIWRIRQTLDCYARACAQA